MNPAIKEIGIDKCSGCFGCYNVCPEKAIKMKISDEGFYIPIIDYNKCTECGICQNNCPVIQIKERKNQNYSDPLSFASWSKDEKTRLTSSSGGVFTELAKKIIDEDGVVFGAIWREDFLVYHQRVKIEEDLDFLKGSKYIQSNVGNSYGEVVQELNKGKKVLFSGTPCQIAALKTFIDNENLITVDLICHGVPSIIVFKKYLEFRNKDKKIVKINFRDKSTGWSNFSFSIEFKNGRKYIKKFSFDPFCWGFNNNYYLNSICYECPFSCVPRWGDITLGDFWGVSKEYKDEKGVSAIIINNTKGKKFFEKINAIEKKIVSLEAVLNRNPRIKTGKLKRPSSREDILKGIINLDFKAISKKYLNPPNEYMIFIRRVINKLLKNLNFKVI